MIEVKKALEIILKKLPERPSFEIISIDCALKRILAKDYVSLHAHPATNTSAMDGYAVASQHCHFCKKNGEFGPVEIIGTSLPAKPYNNDNSKIQGAIRVFTGATVPEGFDTIILQEESVLKDQQLYFAKPNLPWRYIRKAGMDFAKDQPLLLKGKQITSRDIGLLAMMGHHWIEVYKKPNILVISTGNELVLPGAKQTHKIDQMIASSGFSIKTILQEYGANCHIAPLCTDDFKSFSDALNMAPHFDLVITTGGASVGEYDIVAKATQTGLLKSYFKQIKMRPGKPILFSHIRHVPVISLPGNPVSAMIGCLLFLLPALKKLSHHIGAPDDHRVRQVKIAHVLEANGPRQHYMRAQIIKKENTALSFVKAFDLQDSAQTLIFQQADGVIVRDPYAKQAEIGDDV
ncbi:MAG: molybdopterin molybdotransferase MoeA, partial [Pseudomonadota bacterium]